MTQGNCCRMAVGTRPDFAHQGRTRPPPRSAPRVLPGTPTPTSSPARGASLRRSGFPRSKGREGRRRGPALGERVRGQGRRRGGQGSGSLGLGLPRRWGAPGRTASRLRLELCSFSSNYLSEQRVGEGPKKGPPLPEGLPISIRGALLGERRDNILVSLPTSSFLFCCLYSWIRHSLCCFPPSHLGVCSVDAQRTQ